MGRTIRAVMPGSLAGGAAAGDDHRVAGVVVEARDAKVGDRADAGFAQGGGAVVVPGGGDVMGLGHAGRPRPRTGSGSRDSITEKPTSHVQDVPRPSELSWGPSRISPDGPVQSTRGTSHSGEN